MSHPPLTPEALDAKLRSPEGAALLAERWLADVWKRPLGELFVPAEAARTVHEILTGMAQSDSAEAHWAGRAEELCARWEAEERALRDVLPSPWPETALRLAKRPHSPHQKLVLRVLDREPVRQLIRLLLIEALVEFGRKVSAPISGSRVGKGLGALGSLAGAVGAGVLGAVGGELEKQVERKAAEFADTALSRILHRIVDMASDPRRAAEQAELRAALVEGVLEVPVEELVEEVRRANPKSLVAEGRRALRLFVERPESRAELEAELSRAIGPFAERPTGALFDELGIREGLHRGLRELLIARIRAFDWAEVFGALAALPG